VPLIRLQKRGLDRSVADALHLDSRNALRIGAERN